MIYLVLQAIVAVAGLADVLFRQAEVFVSGDAYQPDGHQAVVMTSIASLIQIALTGIWLYEFWLFIRRRKAAVSFFWVAVGARSFILSAYLAVAYFAHWHEIDVEGGAEGLVISFGVAHLFYTSPRSRSVFIT